MNMKKTELTFNDFCYKHCDGLYTPDISLDNQCTGYIKLREMVLNNITPTSLDEIKRWETNPTSEKLWSVPHIKYMRFLHPILRPIIIENWELIKTMKIN